MRGESEEKQRRWKDMQWSDERTQQRERERGMRTQERERESR